MSGEALDNYPLTVWPGTATTIFSGGGNAWWQDQEDSLLLILNLGGVDILFTILFVSKTVNEISKDWPKLSCHNRNIGEYLKQH